MPHSASSEFPDAVSSPGPIWETELKLLISPDDLNRIRRHPLLTRGGRGATRKLRTIYFDTPDLDLRRRGVALRVRRDGRRWVQTIKSGGSAQGGLQRRLEVESRVSGPRPDFLAIREEGLARLFSSKQRREQLKAVFVTEISRTTCLLRPAPGTVIEACIDHGRVRAGDRVEPVCELELELKSGAVSELYRFALQLLDQISLRVGIRSKAERGYALCRNERLLPVKAHRPALRRDMSVGDAFKEIVWTTLGHMQANERGVLVTHNPEFLHQVRVSLRRLRSALGLFAKVLRGPELTSFWSEFKWLAGILGRARDWDVFMTETLPQVQRENRDDRDLAILAKQGERARSSARRRLREALVSQRYLSLMLKFCAWLAGEEWLATRKGAVRRVLHRSVPHFAAGILEHRYARVKKRGRGLKSLSVAELHRLRIAIKKLRYAAAFFSTLYDSRRTAGILAQTRRLQDILGTINDAATVPRLIKTAIDRAARGPERKPGEIVVRWSDDRARRLRPTLLTVWNRFRHVKRFW